MGDHSPVCFNTRAITSSDNQKPAARSSRIQGATGRYQLSILSDYQHAQQPGNPNSKTHRYPAPQLLIDEEQIRPSLKRQDDRFALTCIEISRKFPEQLLICCCIHLDPLGQVRTEFRQTTSNLVPNRIWDQHLTVDFGQQAELPDAVEVDQNRCITDNNHRNPKSFSVAMSCSKSTMA